MLVSYYSFQYQWKLTFAEAGKKFWSTKVKHVGVGILTEGAVTNFTVDQNYQIKIFYFNETTLNNTLQVIFNEISLKFPVHFDFVDFDWILL